LLLRYFAVQFVPNGHIGAEAKVGTLAVESNSTAAARISNVFFTM